MRTKTLLCTAAVVAVGIGASVAQSVYSVNSVGYVNVTLQPGYNLISNPLNGTNNNINTIIPVAPQDTTITRWDVATQTFLASDSYAFVGPGDPANGWYTDDALPSPTVINPGEGFFVQNQSGAPTTITFVGEVPQGPLTNNIGANFGFYASIVPQSVDLLSIGFPGVQDMTYTTWDTAGQTYSGSLSYVFIGAGDPDNGFYNDDAVKVAAVPAVAQGFLIFNPTPNTLPWGRTFSVN